MQFKDTELTLLSQKHVPLEDKYLTLSEVIEKSINMSFKYLWRLVFIEKNTSLKCLVQHLKKPPQFVKDSLESYLEPVWSHCNSVTWLDCLGPFKHPSCANCWTPWSHCRSGSSGMSLSGATPGEENWLSQLSGVQAIPHEDRLSLELVGFSNGLLSAQVSEWKHQKLLSWPY